jgi:DNA-binding transcriptional LysR family regulator
MKRYSEVRAAVAAVGELSTDPRGTLRLLVSSGAEHFIRDDLLASFLAAHVHIQLDIAVSNGMRDIVANGYDAGIQLGEVIDRDMVAVPVSGDLRLKVVGLPLTSPSIGNRSTRESSWIIRASTGIPRQIRRLTVGSSPRMAETFQSRFQPVYSRPIRCSLSGSLELALVWRSCMRAVCWAN